MANFVDLCKLTVVGGRGGDGLVSFRQIKRKRRMKTDGGNGGDGGSVFLVADANLATLYDFTRRRVFTAGSGGRGGPNTKKGAGGQDLVLKVPMGTVVKEAIKRVSDRAIKKEISESIAQSLAQLNRSHVLVDLSEPQQTVLVARGGSGGRGNASLPRDIDYEAFSEKFRFFSGRRKIPPRYCWAEKGEPGEKIELVLELKLLADVGIVGLPNAGKTTLLNQLTASRAEVGEYPFTTLMPNLGVMRVSGATKRLREQAIGEKEGKLIAQSLGRSIILADIPGLIEGAAEGKGLGDDFLRHIERTKILVHLIDPLEGLSLLGLKRNILKKIPQNAWKNYQTIRKELCKWSVKLVDKPEIIVVNKIDVTEIKQVKTQIKSYFHDKLDNDRHILFTSAVTGEKAEQLKHEIYRLMPLFDIINN